MSNTSASQSTTSDSKAPTPTSEVSTASHPTENISRPAVPLTQFRDMSTTDKDSQQKQPDAESSKTVEPEPQPSVTSKKEEQEDDKAQKSQTASKKTKCKHKHKKKKSAMKKSTKKKTSKEESSSSDSSSEDSSSSSSSSSSSDSSSEEESPKKKKKKDKKSKKSKKDGKKVKSIDWGAGDEESEDESLDDLRKKKLKKLSKKSSKDKKKGKKSKKEPESSDDDSDSDDSSDEEDEPDANNFQAQIDSLKMQLANNRLTRGLGGLRNRRSSSLSLKTSKSKKKGKKGNPGFQRVDQLWDNELHNYRLKESAEDEENEFAEFAFLVRRCFNWENRYTETVVDIKSKALRAVLQEVMKNCKSVALEAEEPTIDPNTLFLYLEEFRTHHKKTLKAKIKATKKQKTIKKLTLQKTLCKTLVKYLDTDYADIKKTLYPLLEAGNITFELLWALYKPNEIAITSSYGSWAEPRCFKVDYANKFSTMSRGEWYCVEGRYLEYDGKSFGWADFEVDCESFKGPRKITSLATYPLKYHKEPDAVKKSIIERGQQFVSMEGMQYKAMKGLAFMKKKKQVGKININGRIMIDPATFRRVQPNYPIGNISHNDAEGLMSEDDDDDDSECGCCGSSDEENTAKDQKIEQYDHSEDVPKYKYKWVMDKDGCHERYVRVEVDENGEPLRPNRVDKLAEVDGKHSFSEEELLLTSPVVLGFAFSEKLWLEFSLSGIQDIVYNESAFDSLVLPPNQKEIVRALVESHKSNGAKAIDDVVVGKGQALNCILHGPPGTGKTLTAESISELLHCPLYMVSAGELGVDPSRLEATLQQILDIAHSWGAILLIDEADVFLEARELHDLQRNALVSIFLRLLEYYQGILILTTNRVNTFDDAFQSRIHVALRYGELSKAARMKVWKMFIEMVQKNEGDEAIPLPASDYEALSRHSLNGRQIKNLVKSAQSLALYEKKPMSMDHIRKVLEVAETFDRDLKGGTGYIDAMRSYT